MFFEELCCGSGGNLSLEIVTRTATSPTLKDRPERGGPGRVGLGGVHLITGLVWRVPDVSKPHGVRSGRVSGGCEISRIPGRVG